MHSNSENRIDPGGDLGAILFASGGALEGADAGIGAPVGIATGIGVIVIVGVVWLNNTYSNASSSNPMKGPPGGSSTIHTKNGRPKQTRTYGKDGYPDEDIDYDHDHGAGCPHKHVWGRPTNGGQPTYENRGRGKSL